MTILFLSPSAQRGGAESVLLEIIKALRASKPAWSLHLILGEDGPLLEQARSLDANAEVLSFPRSLQTLGEKTRSHSGTTRILRLPRFALGAVSAFSYQRKLRGRIAGLRPDVVHSNGMKMHFLSALALRTRPKPPLVWHFHDYLGSRPLMSRLLRRVSRRCHRIIAPSESVATDARRVMPLHPPIETIHNAVDSTLFTPDGAKLDLDRLAGSPGSPAGTLRAGLVATFAHWKGHQLFLRSIAHLRAKGRCDHLRFYIIGGPLYATTGSQYQQEELRDTAKELGIEDIVAFTGFVDDVPGAMRALDIVVHASTEPEPFGLVIIQAMACGCAVISSRLGGASELIEPEVDAITFAADEAEALAAAIERLTNDANLRAKLGAAGRAKVERLFSRQEMTRRLHSVYENLRSA